MKTLTRPRRIRLAHSSQLRRRRVSLTETLRRYLDEHPEVVEAIVRALIDRAIGGDMRAMRILLDRVDGPVTSAAQPEVVTLKRYVDAQDVEESNRESCGVADLEGRSIRAVPANRAEPALDAA
jgi:hypothetical protein